MSSAMIHAPRTASAASARVTPARTMRAGRWRFTATIVATPSATNSTDRAVLASKPGWRRMRNMVNSHADTRMVKAETTVSMARTRMDLSYDQYDMANGSPGQDGLGDFRTIERQPSLT